MFVFVFSGRHIVKAGVTDLLSSRLVSVVQYLPRYLVGSVCELFSGPGGRH